jgi:hypothetical protein
MSHHEPTLYDRCLAPGRLADTGIRPGDLRRRAPGIILSPMPSVEGLCDPNHLL